MSDTTSPSSRERLRPFSEYLKEAMEEVSPGLWEWYSSYRPKPSSAKSSAPNGG